jgi:hypothetical protein
MGGDLVILISKVWRGEGGPQVECVGGTGDQRALRCVYGKVDSWYLITRMK